MFTLDVPATPAQTTPIVLAQAAPVATGQPQADFLLKDCMETESGGDPHARTGFNGVSPAYMLKNYLEFRDRKSGRIVDLTSINTILIEGPKHGSFVTEVDESGEEGYWYNATPDYEGRDRVVFMAEFEGKRYKIIIDMRVFLKVDEYHPTCPKPQLIKVKPSSSSLDINGFSVSFSGTLPGGVLGQSIGSTINNSNNSKQQ